MSVMITLQWPNGVATARFVAEDHISLAQMFSQHGIAFPTSCGIGMCGVCTCKIIAGGEHIQIDKITAPSRVLKRNDDESFAEVLACIWGIKTSSIKDSITHEVILEKHL